MEDERLLDVNPVSAIMVLAARFELATSPIPRERSAY